jgi:hypothetical protein
MIKKYWNIGKVALEIALAPVTLPQDADAR